MSQHSIEVVKVYLQPHPYADTLSLVKVFSGYTVVVKTVDWNDGDLAVYIPPDYMVDSQRPEFSFLAGDNDKDTLYRIRTRKFRGVYSMGLLIPAPLGSKEGDEVSSLFGITRYEPIPKYNTGGEFDLAPPGVQSSYDVENLRKFSYVLSEGEPLFISEKIHGCLQASTLIAMSDGTKKFIRDIEIGDVVLGMDEQEKIVQSKVTQVFRNEKTDDWLNIKGTRIGIGRGNSYFSIVCTPQHKFWVNNSFISASKLRVNDTVSMLKYELDITPLQKQVLLGMVIGDGCLILRGDTASIWFSHKRDHLEYVEWKHTLLGEISSNYRRDFLSGYGSSIIQTKTTGNYFVKKYLESFILDNGNRVIPSWVSQELTPISLAIWYMDDGSLSHWEGQEDGVNFAVCSESNEDCEVLLKGLKRFNIEGQLFTDNGSINVLD